MNIWIEKYRPKTLDEMCMSEEDKNYFRQFEKSNDIPHFLFVGEAGRGKTTMARVLIETILKCDYIYINASDETGIDNIRNKVTNFVKTKSLDGNIKIVVLDEADGLSKDAQKCLRNLMEDYISSARFILTANYKHKIITPLQSRCSTFAFKTTLQDVIARCRDILRAENIEFSLDKEFARFVKSFYPDIRKCIGELQRNCIAGKFIPDGGKEDGELMQKILYSCKNNKVLSLREYLIKNDQLFDGDYEQLLRSFLNHIYSCVMDDSKKKNAILHIADGIYQSYFVADKEINAFACLLNVESILTEL